MDDFKELPKPPLLLPEPETRTAALQDAPPMDTSDDLAEVTEIEPRPENAVEEIEQMPIPRERRPPPGVRPDHQGRRGGRDHRDHRGGPHSQHRPRPFMDS